MGVDRFIAKASKQRQKDLTQCELDVEKPFVAYARTRGCKALKLRLIGIRGFPDRTVICPEGRVLFIEFKRKGKTQTGPQIRWMNILQSLGFQYFVCDSTEKAKAVLDDFLF